MTHHQSHASKAMTAIAAALAFASAPVLAQDTVPPDPVVDTANTPATPDPLAPEAADATPVQTDTAVPPPAPKPKVETTRTKTVSAAPAKRTTTSAQRSTPQRANVRRASAAAPMAAAAPSTPAPAPESAQPPAVSPPVATEPAPRAEPAPSSDTTGDVVTELMSNDLALAGAGALGLVALGGAAFAAHRRKRRREDAEFEARQQFLAQADAEREANVEEELGLSPADEVQPGPPFTRRAAPVHDPVPNRTAPAVQPDFMFRRVGEAAKSTVEPGAPEEPSGTFSPKKTPSEPSER